MIIIVQTCSWKKRDGFTKLKKMGVLETILEYRKRRSKSEATILLIFQIFWFCEYTF
ncbi:MAG: hypothetical protein CM15mP58_08480 [Burkholderiaceae bacterium]|nr:MAG: hypothetical protein CM15mP58_08480 [Burkholderiaceae bacterium]